MTKKQTTVKEEKEKKKKLTALIDVHISLPEESKYLMGDGGLHILFNAQVARRIPEIKMSLQRERGIKSASQINEITAISDVLALQLTLVSKLDAESIEFQVKQYYFQMLAQVDRDATFIALTDNVHIPSSLNDDGGMLTPDEYVEEELTVDTTGATVDGGDIPLWRRKEQEENKMEWPPVNYNLDNHYEKRLKWLNDTIAQFDIGFQVGLESTINNHIINAMRGVITTDEDYFHPAPTS